MDNMEIQRVLATLIDYFEAGNRESDAAAKAVLAADSEYDQYWRMEIERFKRSVEWSGLRGPEAEILAIGLRQAAALVAGEQ
jgi:hypothetical protein